MTCSSCQEHKTTDSSVKAGRLGRAPITKRRRSIVSFISSSVLATLLVFMSKLEMWGTRDLTIMYFKQAPKSV